MKRIDTEIDGVFILEPEVFGDSRGYFFETFSQKKFRDVTGLDLSFVQDNESMSSRGVLRGMHFQRAPFAQAKLVRVVKGSVQDVAVDIRPGSPTFGKYVSVVLSEHNKLGLLIPAGFAHGFVVLEENTIFQYKCSEFYTPSAEGSFLWSDPAVGIKWMVPSSEIKLSPKDAAALPLATAKLD